MLTYTCVTEQATFTNSTEVLFAVLTFYQLRVVERLWGSRKFAVRESHHPSFNLVLYKPHNYMTNVSMYSLSS